MSDNDMVKFLMPDGTEVSNDPRFDLREALQKQLNSTPNRGNVGVTQEEWDAQHQNTRLASINSGQPGVGPNATVDDPTEDLHGPLGSPAQQRQASGGQTLDVDRAREAGGSPKSTTVKDPEPVDSNERVLEARKAAAERFAKAAKVREGAGEDPGNTEKPYHTWSAKQLKEEVARRNADGRSEEQELKLSGKNKAEVSAMLEEDDRTVRATPTGGTGAPVRQEDLDNADDEDDDDSSDDDDDES